MYVVLQKVLSSKQRKIEVLRAEGKEPEEQPSIFLKAFLLFMSRIISPIVCWTKDFFMFIKRRKVYWIIWLSLWLGYFNAYAIVIEFFAFYFYFVMSFNVANIFVQIYKLFSDFSVVINFIPGIIWIVLGLILFDLIRKHIGYKRLIHFEMRNRGFINERPIVFMLCGSMGTRKTTLITDMALSQEIMFRDAAKEFSLAKI